MSIQSAIRKYLTTPNSNSLIRDYSMVLLCIIDLFEDLIKTKGLLHRNTYLSTYRYKILYTKERFLFLSNELCLILLTFSKISFKCFQSLNLYSNSLWFYHLAPGSSDILGLFTYNPIILLQMR